MYDVRLLNHVRLITQMYLVSRLKISGVYLHSPISSRCEYRKLYLYYADECRKELLKQQSGVNRDFAETM
jgi:hypothetical protein